MLLKEAALGIRFVWGDQAKMMAAKIVLQAYGPL
jgi:hypothetical protein